MIVTDLRRRAAGLGVALVLGVALIGASTLTPAASAQPPAYSCDEIASLLHNAEIELRGLSRALGHLLDGGVTQDEVVYVSQTLDRMSDKQDEITYLKSLMYQCFRQHGRMPGGWLERMASLAKERKRAASLQAKATALLAKVRWPHR